MESNSRTIAKLNATNYSLWRTMIEDHLYYKDLYEPIKGDVAKPKKMLKEDWKKIKKKTLASICQCVDLSFYNQVSKKSDPHTLWKNIENIYQKKNAQERVFIMRKLMNLKLKKGQSIVKHLNELKGLTIQLSSIRQNMDDHIQATILLGSLPKSWNPLVISLNNLAPDGEVLMNMVKNGLFNEESYLKDVTGNDTQALVTKNKGRSQNRKQSGRPKFKGRSKSRSKLKCYHCQKPRHMKRDCKLPKQEKGKKKVDDNAIVATTTSNNGVTLLCDYERECCHLIKFEVEWIVDSGALYHCVSKKEYFTPIKLEVLDPST